MVVEMVMEMEAPQQAIGTFVSFVNCLISSILEMEVEVEMGVEMEVVASQKSICISFSLLIV